MRLLTLITVLAIVLEANGRRRAKRDVLRPAIRASGVSSQHLVSGHRPRAYRLSLPSGFDGRRVYRWCSICTAAAEMPQGRPETAASKP